MDEAHLITIVGPRNSPWALLGPSDLPAPYAAVRNQPPGNYSLYWDLLGSRQNMSLHLVLQRQNGQKIDIIDEKIIPEARRIFGLLHRAVKMEEMFHPLPDLSDDDNNKGALGDIFNWLREGEDNLADTNDHMAVEHQGLADILSEWIDTEKNPEVVSNLFIEVTGLVSMVLLADEPAAQFER